MMKTSLAWLPLAAVVGGLIGAWGPYEELQAYKSRPSKASSEQRAEKRSGFDPIARLIKVPDEARRPRRIKKPDTKERDLEDSSTKTNSVASSEHGVKPKLNMQRRVLPPEDLQARIEEASELWRTRIQLARAAAIEKLGISENGVEEFDATIDDMNAKLRDSIQVVADMLAEEEVMTPEVGIKLMGEMTTAIAETYDKLGANIDPAARDKLSEMQLVEFIDPSVAEPLIAVKDKVDPRVFAPRGAAR
ncbi:MAG: hypothetical protein J6R80_00745 [Kiritimatiellae bacterium]|nr:hypothetical protein [Kiritimatiellia bacterium]